MSSAPMPVAKKHILFLLAVVTLAFSFWFSPAWLRLCAGIALFLFGMQCLEEGLKNLAGSRMEAWLERSTATPFKGLLFGAGGTLLLQSTTLMTMLTVAFISTGMLQLMGGIPIVLGINLGATGGMWLLAAAGQNISLSPIALPLLVFGFLVSLQDGKGKAISRIILGIAFIFMGIGQMKDGFSDLGSYLNFTEHMERDLLGQLIFLAVGMLLTSMLMSSHATFMLILTALSAGQIELWQGMSMAIGGSIGSSLNVAIIVWLGGNRGGQRLAAVHCLFNISTGALFFIALWPVHWLLHVLIPHSNELLQLALFQTLYNLVGVLLLWPVQSRLNDWLYRLLPDPQEPQVLISAAEDRHMPSFKEFERGRARYLTESALASADTAARAVVRELQHLGRLSLEVICHALYQPVEQLTAERVDESMLNSLPDDIETLDADLLYQRYIKGVYSDLLDFMSRMTGEMDEEHHHFWLSCQLVALQLVDAVKDAKHLQKNLGRYLRDDRSYVHNHYLDLRRHLLWVLRQVRELGRLDAPDEVWSSRLEWLDGQSARFDNDFRQRVFSEVRKQQLDSLQASSLINDLGYCSRITQSLRNVLHLGLMDENQLLHTLRYLGGDEDSPLTHI